MLLSRAITVLSKCSTDYLLMPSGQGRVVANFTVDDVECDDNNNDDDCELMLVKLAGQVRSGTIEMPKEYRVYVL